jgi:hypothetical protein
MNGTDDEIIQYDKKPKITATTIGWLALILAIMGIAITVLLAGQHSSNSENDTRFCIEWSGNIMLTSIPVYCYDYSNNRLLCAWATKPDGSLEVVMKNLTTNQFQNVSVTYNCTKWITGIVTQK